MKRPSQIFKLFFLLIISSLANAQDRNQGFQYNLPSDLIIENGGRFINVKSEPFNAKGDGVTDDTRAFIEAYNYFVELIGDKSADKDPLRSYAIYIPDGTYLISSTIIYEGDVLPGYCSKCEGITQLRFIGQSRENTIIRLMDNAPGFADGTPDEIVSFGKNDFNNTAAANNIRNLTINTGTGNPDAVGLKMGGANNASGSNLLIKSEDGQGAVGLDFNIGTVVGWYHDITIEGFDIGIRFPSDNFIHPIVEHATLTGQNQYAMKFEGLGSATLRKIVSNNSVPAIYGDDMGVFPSVIDCDFSGGDGGNAAIDLVDGQLFARNISVSGYGTSIRYKNADEVTGNIEEWTSSGPYTFDASTPEQSMNLEIEPSPVYWNPDTNQWASVHDYGAVGDGETDDSDAIQAALNSGKPVVYFTNALYRVNTPLKVPPSVKLIEGFYSTLHGDASHKFVIEEYSGDPVIIADFRMTDGTNYNHASKRTLVMDNTPTQSNLYDNTSPVHGGKLFVNNCNGLKSQGPIENVKAWIRHVNTEARNTQFVIKNSQVVVLAYKTEKNHTSFHAREGSRLEILGGQSNQQAWDNSLNNPALLNENSEVSAVFTTAQGWSQGYDTVIVDIQGEDKKIMVKEAFPKRTAEHEVIRAITLYNSYDPAPVNVSGIDIINDTITLIKGDSTGIEYEIFPFMADNDTASWTSFDASVVTVSSDGEIMGVDFGESQIVVTTGDGSFSDTVFVKIVDAIHVDSFHIMEAGKFLLPGELFFPAYAILPEDATKKKVNWSTSNEAIATVSEIGEIKAVAQGITYIYGITEDSERKDSLKITVVPVDPFYEIDGEIVVEAEHFHSSDPRDEKVNWIAETETAGSVGSYIVIPDGTGSSTDGPEHLTKASVAYVLHFENPGNYKLFVRRYATGGGDNSAFFFFNGEQLSSFDNTGDPGSWVWKDLGTMEVPEAGDYLLEMVRREDGYKVDRIVVTMNSAPTREGPAESPELSELTLLTGFSFSSDTIMLEIGERRQLQVSYMPADASIKNLQVEVDDESVISLSDSMYVAGLIVGTTTVHATTIQGGFTDAATVQVKLPVPDSFQLNMPANDAAVTETLINFSWEEAAYASAYSILIDNDDDFSSPEIALFNLTSETIEIDIESLPNGTYFWKVIASNDAGSTEIVGTRKFSFLLTDMDSNPFGEKITVYPNPVTKNKVFVKIQDGIEINKLEIFSALGNKMYTDTDVGKLEIVDMTGFPRGVYILKVSNRDYQSTRLMFLQ